MCNVSGLVSSERMQKALPVLQRLFPRAGRYVKLPYQYNPQLEFSVCLKGLCKSILHYPHNRHAVPFSQSVCGRLPPPDYIDIPERIR